MLDVGDSAPDFILKDQHGNDRSLQSFLEFGRAIIYFYPFDFSPVCTAEACAFRDSLANVPDLGVTVVGISPQSVQSHAQFAKLHSLNFTLLSDTRSKTIRDFGVAGPFGLGVRRATFLIDTDKLIRKRVVADFSSTSHVQLLKDTLAAANSND